MKLLGIAALVLGVVLAALSIGIAVTSPGLAGPGADLGITPDFSFRLVIGPLTLVSAVALTTGWIALRRFPRAAWLALLSFVVLAVPYLVVVGLAPAWMIMLALILINVVVGPVVVGIVAWLIALAVRKREARVAPAGAAVSYGPPAAS